VERHQAVAAVRFPFEDRRAGIAGQGVAAVKRQGQTPDAAPDRAAVMRRQYVAPFLSYSLPVSARGSTTPVTGDGSSTSLTRAQSLANDAIAVGFAGS